MASNPPPFEVEDQTDEDFFDKLVDDDIDLGPVESAPKFSQRNHSDDANANANAFSNLSIADVAEDSVGESGFEPINDKGFVDSNANDRNLLVSTNAAVLDSVPELNDAGAGSKSTSDSMIGSKSSESGSSSGFKVVGWSSFHADVAQNGGSHGLGSYSDFFNELDGDASVEFPGKLGDNSMAVEKTVVGNVEHRDDSLNGVINYMQYPDGQDYGTPAEQSTNAQDLNSSEYWESLYPGWKYDPNTGQWYQVDGFGLTAKAQGGSSTNSASDTGAVSEVKTKVSYLQQTSHCVMGTAAETSTSQSVSNWNQSQVNNGYPELMVFDPQYPGWYYDTIAQEWRLLDAYASTVQSTVNDYGHQNQNGFVSSITYSQNESSSYNESRQAENYVSGSLGSQGQDGSWGGSYGNDNQNIQNKWQAEAVSKTVASMLFSGNQQLDNSYGSNFSTNKDQQKSSNSFGGVPSYDRANQGHNEANRTLGYPSFNAELQPYNQANAKLNDQMQFSNEYYGSQKPVKNEATGGVGWVVRNEGSPMLCLSLLFLSSLFFSAYLSICDLLRGIVAWIYWVLLPNHLLDLILEKLDSSKDYMQFGVVCVSWHSAMKFNEVKHITSPRHQHQVPILLVPDQDERTLSVYDVMHEKFLDLKVLIPHTERFCGSSKGWLIAVNRDYSVTLYKPYFMAKNENSGSAYTSLCLNLPRLFPRSPEDEECFSYPIWSHHVFKAIITADPLEDANKCIVLTIFGEYLQLAYTSCAKDTTWTMIGVEYGPFDDILCCKNQVYALSYHGILISFDITDSGILLPKFDVPGISPREVWWDNYISKRYIVESYGELFQVFRYIDFHNTIRRTVMFEVFKLEYDMEKWIHIDSLGDVSFFLGDSSSIAVLASNFAECEPNCIYFTQDKDACFGSFISSIRDLGIFELESIRFKLYFNIGFTALRKMLRQPPIWIVPTVDLY